ncbi:LFA3 protein, partial [Cettia cetti]|nr:LFA3 protein [Cettia cetti]
IAHIYCNDVVGIVGENFTFPVESNQRMVEIVWVKNKDKVAEREGDNSTAYFGPRHYRNVLTKDGSLTIVNLEKDDAGTYELHYWDSKKDHYLKFVLVVLDFPEPKTSCNTSNGELILNCTADFQESVNYTWKLDNDPRVYPLQELSIPWRDVTATKATCTIKFSQTERSSEIFLTPCRP